VKISGSQAGGVPQLLAPFGDFGMSDDICGVIIAAFTGKNCSQPVSCFSSPLQRRRPAGVLLRAGESLIPPWCANCKRLATPTLSSVASWKSDAEPGPWSALDRISYSVFQRFNLDWKNRTLKLFTQAA
jgi:hypothetical protein